MTILKMSNSYANLTNKEIIFTYTMMKSYIEEYETLINDKGCTGIIDLPGQQMEVFINIRGNELDLISNNIRYTTMKNICNKLTPIVDLIKESEEDYYEEINNEFFPEDSQG